MNKRLSFILLLATFFFLLHLAISYYWFPSHKPTDHEHLFFRTEFDKTFSLNDGMGGQKMRYLSRFIIQAMAKEKQSSSTINEVTAVVGNESVVEFKTISKQDPLLEIVEIVQVKSEEEENGEEEEEENSDDEENELELESQENQEEDEEEEEEEEEEKDDKTHQETEEEEEDTSKDDQNEKDQGEINVELDTQESKNEYWEVPLEVTGSLLPKVTLSGSSCSFARDSKSASCPNFFQCDESNDEIFVCFNDNYSDEGRSLQFSLGESSTIKMLEPPSEAHVFLIKNVYVDFRGFVFNENEAYLHGSCVGGNPFPLNEGQKIIHFKEAINLAHIWSHNFYHHTVEMVSRLFVMRDFIIKNPHIPILVKVDTRVPQLIRLLELEEYQLEFIFLKVSQVVHVEKSYTPLKPRCGGAPVELWKYIRKLTMKNYPMSFVKNQNGLIVVSRQEKSNSIEGYGAVIAALQHKYPRVILYDGTEGVDSTREIFSEASIFISRGPGVANIAYMPTGSTVVELVATKSNYNYVRFAVGLGINHHFILCSLSNKRMRVDLNQILYKVEEILNVK